MLEQITDYLTSEISKTNYFEKIFPLVELFERGDGISSPEQYCGKGQYQKVNDFDSYNGVAYFRQTASEAISKVEPENTGCKLLIQIITPLRLVACIPKSKLTSDDAFSDDRVLKTLMKVITGEGGVITGMIKATSISFMPYAMLKDRKEILAQEYPGKNQVKMNFNFAYVAIDFNVTVQIYDECIMTECEELY